MITYNITIDLRMINRSIQARGLQPIFNLRIRRLSLNHIHLYVIYGLDIAAGHILDEAFMLLRLLIIL